MDWSQQVEGDRLPKEDDMELDQHKSQILHVYDMRDIFMEFTLIGQYTYCI